MGYPSPAKYGNAQYADVGHVNDPVTIVCFKWNRQKTGLELPHVCDYGHRHVNILKASIDRNTTRTHRFICVTDDWSCLNKDIEVVQLWDKCLSLGGCFNRLFVFSEIMRKYLGDRFICIDLDCVITGNIDDLLRRQEDFVINQYPKDKPGNATQQHYNGGLFMMDAGARKQVWDTFDPLVSPSILEERKTRREVCGSDQAWIAHTLGDGEAMFTPADGVYDYRVLGNRGILPADAKIVMFPGRRDPSTERDNVPWIRRCWQ